MGRRNRAADDVASALTASNARNRELCAENEKLRALLEAARKKLAGVNFQLDFHKGELSRVQADRAAETVRAEDAERRRNVALADLERAQVWHAEQCPHTAEVRNLKDVLTALEQRVRELQAANEGWYRHEHDVVFPPEESRAAVAAATVRRALGRKQGS